MNAYANFPEESLSHEKKEQKENERNNATKKKNA